MSNCASEKRAQSQPQTVREKKSFGGRADVWYSLRLKLCDFFTCALRNDASVFLLFSSDVQNGDLH